MFVYLAYQNLLDTSAEIKALMVLEKRTMFSKTRRRYPQGLILTETSANINENNSNIGVISELWKELIRYILLKFVFSIAIYYLSRMTRSSLKAMKMRVWVNVSSSMEIPWPSYSTAPLDSGCPTRLSRQKNVA